MAGIVFRSVGENGITEQRKMLLDVLGSVARAVDHVNLDGECPGNEQAGRRKLRSCGRAPAQGGLCEVGGSLGAWSSPSAPPCRAAGRMHAGNRPPVIGEALPVGIMNWVVSAEVIGRALLQ